MSWSAEGPGWWQASDGLWYPPASPPGAPAAGGSWADTTQGPPVEPPGRGVNRAVVAMIGVLIVVVGVLVAVIVLDDDTTDSTPPTTVATPTTVIDPFLPEGSRSSSCRIEARTVRTAEEAHRAMSGGYVAEAELTPDWIERQSDLFDVELNGASGTAIGLRLVPTTAGGCDGLVSADELVSGTPP